MSSRENRHVTHCAHVPRGPWKSWFNQTIVKLFPLIADTSTTGEEKKPRTEQYQLSNNRTFAMLQESRLAEIDLLRTWINNAGHCCSAKLRAHSLFRCILEKLWNVKSFYFSVWWETTMTPVRKEFYLSQRKSPTWNIGSSKVLAYIWRIANTRSVLRSTR